MIPNNKIISYPLRFIGLIMIILGVRWLIHAEPWMLDEVANVERLGMTFKELFEPEINKTLPGYLTQIYRFFGFWVLIIGLLIFNLTKTNIIVKREIGDIIFFIIAFMMGFGLYLGYRFIPNSHFIILIWGLLILYLVSLFSYYQLHKNK